MFEESVQPSGQITNITLLESIFLAQLCFIVTDIHKVFINTKTLCIV